MGVRRTRWLQVAAWALVGVVLNVLATWALTITVKPSKFRAAGMVGMSVRREQDPERWPHSLRAGVGKPSIYLRSEGWSLTDDFAYWRGVPSAGRSEYVLDVWRFGVPLQSLSCWYENDPVGGVSVPHQWHGCWKFNNQWAAGTLPLVPVWPGFIVDGALWGLAAWGVAAGPGWARRRWRRRRGACVRCGYDLRGLSGGPCPECGMRAGA